MFPFLYFLLGLAAALILVWAKSRYADFRAQVPGDYAACDPKFDLRAHLRGPLQCEGVIYGPTGRVSSRFVADMEATWEGNKGLMTERFRYDDGAIQDRAWRLTLAEDGRITAEADDLIGAGQGMQAGSGAQLRYRIRLPESSGGHVLDAVDWMYVIDNGTIMNRSQFRKYGIKVAELVATMRPKAAA